MVKRKKKSSAFTKDDAKHLERRLVKRIEEGDQRLEDRLIKRMDEGDQRLEDRLIKRMDEGDQRLVKFFEDQKRDIFRHFDVKTEQLVHDFGGIFGDRTSQHDDQLKDHAKRIVHIEEHLGIAL